jgi:ATP-dependent exoDNAse (exonuclease V) alpha subunit
VPISDAAKQVIDLLEHDHVFLTGGAGVGKSYTTKEVIAFYEKLGKNVAVLASTGIAAVHLGGQTLHSFLKFGIAKILPELIETKLYPHQRKALKSIVAHLDLLVIDEISMVSAGVMAMVRYRLEQFGFRGRVLVVGDFLQLPPVRKSDEERRLMFQFSIDESEKERYFGYAFESEAWGAFGFETVELEEVKRTDDATFIRYLHDVRNGVCDRGVKAFIASLATGKLTKELAENSTLLYATNHKVREFNESRLCAGSEPIFDIAAKVSIQSSGEGVERRVEQYIENLPVERTLRLKVGAPVLFTTNTEQFRNGQRGVVTAIENGKEGYAIAVRIDGGGEVNVEQSDYELTHYDFEKDKEGKVAVTQNVIAKVIQFPLRLAWSLTIHKSQGMSIDRIAVSIDEIFEKSQFYVAISRATSPEGLTLLSRKSPEALEAWIERMIMVDEKVLGFYRNDTKAKVKTSLF